jgi:hypothetical protein
MSTETVQNCKGQVDGRKLRSLADQLNNELPGGYGFALIVVELDKQERRANYISNIHDDFMIKTLESHLFSLKHKRIFPTPED